MAAIARAHACLELTRLGAVVQLPNHSAPKRHLGHGGRALVSVSCSVRWAARLLQYNLSTLQYNLSSSTLQRRLPLTKSICNWSAMRFRLTPLRRVVLVPPCIEPPARAAAGLTARCAKARRLKPAAAECRVRSC